MESGEVLQFALSGVTLGSIYALIALGFAVMLNATSLLNFAQGQFVMLGGILAVVLTRATGWPIPAAIMATVVIAAALNGLIERGLIRGAHRADRVTKELITFGVGIVIESVVLLLLGADEFSLPYFSTGIASITLWTATLPTQALWIMGTAILAMLGMIVFYRWTIHGQAMLACSMNSEAASLVGISPASIATLSFVLGGGLGALGGTLIAPIVSLNFSIGLVMSLKGFAALVVGGMGSIFGAVVGGLIIGLLEAFSAGFLSTALKEIFPMVVIIAMLLLRPRGIFGRRA